MNTRRRMIARLAGYKWIVVLLLILQGCGQQNEGQVDQSPGMSSGDVVGMVNGTPISEAAFQQRLQEFPIHLPSTPGSTDAEVSVALKRKIVWQLIDEKLLTQEAGRRNVTVSDAEMDHALAAFKDGFPSPQAFEDYLAVYPGGLPRLQEAQRLALLRNRLAGNPPTVSDEDAARYYQQHQHRYQHPAYLRADEIVLLDQSGRDELSELSVLRHRIVNEGLSFAQQARVHSQGETAERGGDMGRVTSESVGPEIWNAIRAVPAGQISPPISLSDRTLLVRVRENVAAGSKNLGDVAAEIRREMTQRLQQAREVELIERLRADAAVANRFAEAGQANENANPTTLGAGASPQDLGPDLKQGDSSSLNGPGA